MPLSRFISDLGILARYDDFVGMVLLQSAGAQSEGEEVRLVGELAVGNEVEGAAPFERSGSGGKERFSEIRVFRLPGVERRVGDDMVVPLREAFGHIVPMESCWPGDINTGAG